MATAGATAGGGGGGGGLPGDFITRHPGGTTASSSDTSVAQRLARQWSPSGAEARGRAGQAVSPLSYSGISLKVPAMDTNSLALGLKTVVGLVNSYQALQWWLDPEV